MTRREALTWFETACFDEPSNYRLEVYYMAISALREQEALARNSHDVASYKQVTEPLRPNGFSDSAESLATKNQVTSKWISVEDRLPEDERNVLAYYGFDNDGSGDLGMMFMGALSYYCCDPEPHWQHASIGLVVTHWMPLPEPPGVTTDG